MNGIETGIKNHFDIAHGISIDVKSNSKRQMCHGMIKARLRNVKSCFSTLKFV